MWQRLAMGSLVACSLGLGCAEDRFIYRPTEQATATVDGLPAARYEVPPERPVGNVLVASPGVVEAKFQSGVTSHLLSVRMVIENNQDDTPWTVDTREQRAIVQGAGDSAPAYVNTDGQSPPILEVLRGEKHTIDLYFPLPANADDPKHVPEFDFAWQVHTSDRAVADRTSFDRMRLEPVYDEPYFYSWGLAPYWWYDPLWRGPSYVAPTFRYYRARPVYFRVAARPGPSHH